MAPSRATPHPDPLILTGVVLGAIGYAMPWFRIGSRQWFFSGWGFVTEGGGWTLWTFAFLLAALIAAVWAGGNGGAAVTALVATLGAIVLAVVVVSASLADGSPGGVLDIEFGLGVPVMAIGLGLATAGAISAIAHEAAAEAEDRIRRRYFPA